MSTDAESRGAEPIDRLTDALARHWLAAMTPMRHHGACSTNRARAWRGHEHLDDEACRWLTIPPPIMRTSAHDDLEYDPRRQPAKSAKAWLNRLQESEDAFDRWHDHCDNIDKLYASLERLATNSASNGRAIRDREFAMFWANCEVIKPSDLRQRADAGGDGEIHGPPAGLPAGQRGDGAMLHRRVRSHAHQRSDAAGARRPRADRPRRAVVPLRERQGQLRHRARLHRLQGAPRLPALAERQLAGGDVGRRRQLPDAQRGAQAVQEALRRHVPERRVQGRQGRQGSRRRRQPRARQVLGDLEQGRREGDLGRARLRGHARRERPAPRPAELLSVPEAGLRHAAARLAGARPRRDAVQGPARRDQPADRAHPRAVATRWRRKASTRPAAPSWRRRCRPRWRRTASGRLLVPIATGRHSAAPRKSSSGCRST